MPSTTHRQFADPQDYDGRPICFVCASDAQGTEWPLCADRRPDGTTYTHEETCLAYHRHPDAPSMGHEYFCPMHEENYLP